MEKTMKIIYILIIISLLTGCIFSKSDNTNKEYFTIKENTPLITQKYDKPGLLYYPKNNYIEHENDIIIDTGYEMARETKNGEMKWKVQLAPTKKNNKIEKYQDKIWGIGEKVIAYSLETGGIEYEAELNESTSIVHTLGFKGDNIYFVKKPFGEEKVILQEWSISEKKEKRTFGNYDCNNYNYIPVAVDGDMVYFSHNGYDGRAYNAKQPGYMKNAEIVAVSLDTFEEVWSYELPSGEKTIEWENKRAEFVFERAAKSNFIFYKEMIIIPSSSGMVALNKKTGKRIWSNIGPFDTEQKNGVPSIISTLVFDEKKGRLFAIGQNYDFNLNNKIEDWNREQNIFCVDVKSGKKIWARGTGFSMSSSPTLYKDNLYVSSGRKMIVADANTGNIKAGMWYEDTNQAAWSIGFIDGEGLIFQAERRVGFDPID